MAKFRVKKVSTPLFGPIANQGDQNKEAWFAAFSSSSSSDIEIGATELDLIAEDLELDADGLLRDAENYVEGKYRPKAEGIGGSTLGNLGEVLTYILTRSEKIEIIRVLSWKAGDGQGIKGTKFPQPDFLIKDGTSYRALEVKSTEAFDFKDLRDTEKKWVHLRPCSSAELCRAKALHQLGFKNGAQTSPEHLLEIAGGEFVPFPVNEAVAVSVIASDGRTNALRNIKKYKTPPTCRLGSRDCWQCVPEDCNFVLVRMPNSPGRLSLGGSAGDNTPNLLRSYARWTQAITIGDVYATRETLNTLVDSLLSWTEQGDAIRRKVLNCFWGSYLSDSMRSRGLEVEIPSKLGDLRDLDGIDFKWIPGDSRYPRAQDISPDEFSRRLQTLGRSGFSDEPLLISKHTSLDGKKQESLTARIESGFIVFSLLSQAWWDKGSIETGKDASELAIHFLSLVLGSIGARPLQRDITLPLSELNVQVGDQNVLLGWEPRGDSLLRTYYLLADAYHFDWPFTWFAYPAPVTMHIRPDGRANLRVPARFPFY